MLTQNKKGGEVEYLLNDNIATPAGRRESRVVAGSKYIRTASLFTTKSLPLYQQYRLGVLFLRRPADIST